MPIDEEPAKVVLTLTAGPARFTKQMAARMEVSVPEIVRRALTVMHLVISLDPDEDLVVRNRKTNEMERVRFIWDNADDDMTWDQLKRTSPDFAEAVETAARDTQIRTRRRP